ncbi:hypothetical protein D3C81_1461560 [compost metagenome]
MLLLHQTKNMTYFHGFRYIQYRSDDFSQIKRFIMLRKQNIRNMHKADNLVFILNCNRIAGMLRIIHYFHILFPGQIRIETIHIRTRQHDFTGKHVRKIENVIHQLHFIFINDTASCTLIHQNTDFFLRVRCLSFTCRLYSDQAKHRIG